MKLFPQHLRDRQHAEIIRRRSYGLRGKGDVSGSNPSSKPLPPPHTGTLGRLWKKNSGLTDTQAATGLPAASMSTLTTMWAYPTLAASIGLLASAIVTKKTGHAEVFAFTSAATAAISYLSTVPLARAAFRSCYKQPLVEGEIEHLLENEAASASELETAYLRLLLNTVRQKAPVRQETEADIQAAITALGEAIDRLPVVSVTPLNTVALRREADALRTEALHQRDQVISKSLERRADAILRRTEANERSALGVMRIAALRAEIEAQIAGLREGIAALDVGYRSADHATANDLASLSESARRVAAEATSTADAHAELGMPPSYVPIVPTTPTRCGTQSETLPHVQVKNRS